MKPSKIMPEVVRQVALQGAAVVPLRGGDPLLLEKGEVVEERRVEGGLTRKGLGGDLLGVAAYDGECGFPGS
jgi:hypothetical protein